MIAAILNFYGYFEGSNYIVYYEIAGTATFIKSDIIITAHHVINKDFFSLRDGFVNKQSFAICDNDIAIEIEKDEIFEHKNIDISIIKLPTGNVNASLLISQEEPVENQEIFSVGFLGGEQPDVQTKSEKLKISIEKIKFKDLTQIKKDGFITNVYCLTLQSADLDLKNVNTIKTSYGGFVGMSGGPVFDKTTNALIGIISHGDPEDSDTKEFLYATDCTEINKLFKE